MFAEPHGLCVNPSAPLRRKGDYENLMHARFCPGEGLFGFLTPVETILAKEQQRDITDKIDKNGIE